MTTLTARLCIALLCLWPGLASACLTDCLIDDYFRLLEQTQQEKASNEDVERLLAFYADEVIYEHPRVGATIEGKEAIRKGMLAFLGQTRYAKITVENHLGDRDVVVVEFDRSFEQRDGEQWLPRNVHQVTLFEFTDNKISRVRDYW